MRFATLQFTGETDQIAGGKGGGIIFNQGEDQNGVNVIAPLLKIQTWYQRYHTSRNAVGVGLQDKGVWKRDFELNAADIGPLSAIRCGA